MTPVEANQHPETATLPAIWRRAIPLAVFLITFVTFLPAIRCGFVWDDFYFIVRNPNVHGLSWPNFAWALTTYFGGHYIPLLWLTHCAEYPFYGINPAGYHLTNVALHSLNAVLVYFLVQKVVSLAAAESPETSPATMIGAGIAALLFSIHPLRVESVAWVSERRGILSGTFYFLTLLCYLSQTRRWIRLSFVTYALSLLSKEIGVTLPIVLLLLDVYPLRRYKNGLSIWVEKAPYFILALASGAAAIVCERLQGNLAPLATYGIASRILQATYGCVFYLSKTIIPAQLSPFYALPRSHVLWDHRFISATIAATGITFLFVHRRRTWPWGLPLWGFYVVSLLPILGFFQNGFQLVADRYSYIPSVAWVTVAGAAIASTLPRRALSPARFPQFVALMSCATVILIFFGYMSTAGINVWHDDVSLWTRAVELEPDAAFAQANLGEALDVRKNFGGAIDHYRIAVTLDPNLWDTRLKMAVALARTGQTKEAAENLAMIETGSPETAALAARLIETASARQHTENRGSPTIPSPHPGALR